MLSKEELVDLVLTDKECFNEEIKKLKNADMSEVDFLTSTWTVLNLLM